MESELVIIQGSARTNGDTKFFSQKLAEKLKADLIELKDLSIGHYDYDHKNSDDDFLPLIRQLIKYKVWIIATPIYWYSMSGRTKVFLDRLSDLLQTEKALGRQLRGKSLATFSVSNDDDVPDSFFKPLILTADYLGMHYLGDTHLFRTSTEVNNLILGRLESLAQLINKTLEA